jgi:heme A synthase
LAYVTSGLAYLLIVLGGVVRITGSGMGCGDDWPLCNGRIIPSLSDTATLIEWGHRLVAGGLSALVVAVAVLAYRRRHEEDGPRGAPFPLALWAVALLVVQVLLGAVTVWLELPPFAVILHLGTAMAMLAVLMMTGLRAGAVATTEPRDPKIWRASVAALGLGGLALLMGGVTANTGAAAACMGFPLCSGEFWPSESGGLGHIHWFHRLVAYGLTLHLIGMVARVRKRKATAAVQRWVMIACGVTALQIVVGAGMMLSILQPHWRATHVAVGSAVWMALVVLAWEAWPGRPGEVTPA